MTTVTIDVRDLEVGTGFVQYGVTKSNETTASLPTKLRWVDKDHEVISEWIDIGSVKEISVEYADENGNLEWTTQRSIDPIDLPRPSNAKSADVKISYFNHVSFDLEQLLPRKLGQPEIKSFGNPDAAFRIAIISERFDDHGDFVQRVDQYAKYMASLAPFDQLFAEGQICIDSLYWPSDPSNGHFNTDDSKSIGGRWFYGTRPLAKEMLDPWLQNYRMNLILINSELRGGAGGSPGWSSWGSIGSPDWMAVSVHELGHAFGLADEYRDAGPFVLYAGQPNVSNSPRPSQTPWSEHATEKDDPVPNFPIGAALPDDDNIVGTFAGAFYRDDWYRPTARCIMNSTPPDARFCIVCQSAILQHFDST